MTDQVTNEQDNSIFDDKDNADKSAAPDQSAKTSSNSPDIDAIFKDALDSITDTTGKPKYKDVITALGALKYTQEHIKTLEEENKAFKESKTQTDTVDEALKRMSAKDIPTEKTISEEINAEKIKELAAQTVQELDRGKLKAANKKAVSDALLQKYGDVEKAKQAYKDKASELGINVDMLMSIAETSPKAVLAYFGTTATNTSFSKESRVNTESLSRNTTDKEVDYSKIYTSSNSPALAKWQEVTKTLN